MTQSRGPHLKPVNSSIINAEALHPSEEDGAVATGPHYPRARLLKSWIKLVPVHGRRGPLDWVGSNLEDARDVESVIERALMALVVDHIVRRTLERVDQLTGSETSFQA